MGAFKVISADSHIVEPPDIYTLRIEPKFRERAPRIERHMTPGGREYDAWMAGRGAGWHLGSGNAGRAAVRGPFANRLSRHLGGCAERRLRPP
jgi:hypothetical protein